MKIFGISGKTQSGKSTVADYIAHGLADDGHSVFIVGFSRGVKWEFVDLYGWNWSGKYMNSLTDLDQQDVKDMPFKGKTVRDELIRIGIEYRKEDPNVWVNWWKDYLKGFDDDVVVIVPDVRYPNEVKAIQDMGGVVIRLIRNPIDAQDETETALDFADEGHWNCQYFNHIIDNAVIPEDITCKLCLDIARGVK